MPHEYVLDANNNIVNEEVNGIIFRPPGVFHWLSFIKKDG
jgi:hypothetical protein